MQKNILIAGAILGLLGVAIGAFGAHGLKGMLAENGRLETFETAVKYQFYHALALLLIGLFMFHMNDPLLHWAGILMGVGTLIFSGSLYILCLSNVGWWGAITPIGGTAMIAGWGCAIYAFMKL
ncbi:DUF423 domain-containing protein [Algivirga pacifica]|uniref:DUF423 domain-containing protein n=1 Tax=Algivirga pacifica TaxID=1162670 RepID=A0ABP9DQ76_9BACT